MFPTIMNHKQTLSEYLKVLKTLERRIKVVEKRQKDMDEKLDHIMFRLISENSVPDRCIERNHQDNGKNGFFYFKDI